MTRQEMQIVLGIITISDRASGGQYQDLGGPAVKAAAEKHGWDVLAEAIVPDDKKRIQETIRSFSAQGCGLILTTGGTGVAERDVTPEAIREIMRLEIPGFGEVMRAQSMKITPHALRSHNGAGVSIATPARLATASSAFHFPLDAHDRRDRLAHHGLGTHNRSPIF